MRVAVFGKSISEDFFPNLCRMVERLEERGVDLVCEQAFAAFLRERFNYRHGACRCFDKSSLVEQGVDLLLSVGGDGTFLDSVVYVKGSGIPVLGVNGGRLGFLANISADEIDDAVDCLCTGRYTTEQRNVLRAEVTGESFSGFNYALNEISILKTETSSLLKVHAYIDGVYLTTYWADGLIVATPTGSTAYSLSGGGPILSPDCRNIILTPICPHNLSMRPLVVPDSVKLKLKVDGRSGDFMLGLDARMKKMQDCCDVEVCTGDFKINVVKLLNHNYYETLRNKLMWGEDRRNGGRE